MSLRCSLLGHEYGESEIEREREERGNEVVISVVELERCVHCGKTQTISENTEVTQLSSTRADAVRDRSQQPTEATTEGPGIEPRPDVVSTLSQTEPNAGIRSRPDPQPGAVDSGSEDGEIIEEGPADEPDGSERESGAWPDAAERQGGAASESAWPETDGEDEGFDATAPDGKTDLKFGGGLTPQADQGAEIIGSSGGSNDGGETEPTFVSAGPRPAPDRPAESAGETTLYCPNCATAGLDDRSSLRAGDICPECHKGYLSERER